MKTQMRGRTTNKRRSGFGARLAQKRKSLGISQETLAAKLGVDRSTVRYYERNVNDPKLSVVLRCAQILGAEVAELIPAASSSLALAADVARFANDLMALTQSRRAFALRLFKRQLGELRK